ncbi:hypothetical protein A9G49_20205 [Aeromonas sp. ANP5]|nr:hypothetical protein A9G04_20310 [Aeromonas sp. ANNP30]OEC61866.1 hypothetical protein A9G49_20205 [Aeromonas sp. ANP5]
MLQEMLLLLDVMMFLLLAEVYILQVPARISDVYIKGSVLMISIRVFLKKKLDRRLLRKYMMKG